MTQKNKPSLSYKSAGVDIDAGNAFVERIKPYVKSTQRPEVLGGIGGFGALFDLAGKYKNPVLVSCTDGVGTKLKLAIDYKKHDTVGIDLVAMSVNDLIVQGAEPLFFLDYLATSKLNIENAADVVKGIAEGCSQAGAALVGGETAEMPGMYQSDDYDLAGFCVGAIEKDALIDGHQAAVGDSLIALASSGPHSNGYSLIRKVLEISGADTQQNLAGKPLIDHLMAPTRIYVKAVLALLNEVDVHAMAHITGGGLLENLPRTLPQGTQAVVDTQSWQWPSVFQWLQTQGNIDTEEMYRTFNCGVGMVLCLPVEQEAAALSLLSSMGEDAWTIGQLINDESHHTPIRFV